MVALERPGGIMRKSETKFNGGEGSVGARGRKHDEKHSRECHLRFVLSRLKCILKGNRERVVVIFRAKRSMK